MECGDSTPPSTARLDASRAGKNRYSADHPFQSGIQVHPDRVSLDPLEIARAFPVRDGIIEGLRLELRGVAVEVHNIIAERRSRKFASLEQHGCRTK
jgi:hypothetical protein